MLAADTFFSSQAMLAVVVALVALAAFALGWLLLGTAARVKADRDMAARMAAIGRPVPQPTASAGRRARAAAGSRRACRRSASGSPQSQGFGEKLDAQLEAAGVSLRSGEFVVATVGRRRSSAACSGAALLQKPLLALVFGRRRARASHHRPAARSSIAGGDKMREQLPDVLTIMASSLRAGHSFLQALDTVGAGDRRPAADVEFQRLVAEIRLGRPAEDALEALADRVGSADFRWAVLAVNIQREVGGNLAEILDNVADTLRERAMMRRQIQVLTAEGRLSAWVLAHLAVRDRGSTCSR